MFKTYFYQRRLKKNLQTLRHQHRVTESLYLRCPWKRHDARTYLETELREIEHEIQRTAVKLREVNMGLYETHALPQSLTIPTKDPTCPSATASNLSHMAPTWGHIFLTPTKEPIMATHHHYHNKSKRKYGLCNFAFDCLMTVITGGFWLIWVFAREMRNR